MKKKLNISATVSERSPLRVKNDMKKNAKGKTLAKADQCKLQAEANRHSGHTLRIQLVDARCRVLTKKTIRAALVRAQPPITMFGSRSFE